ncbi:MAG TPA: DUF2844 domain-containing protein [Candidatus Angelobacter sp.]|jgi:hypothetical protein|nr:DUF2844 domain-containing protein [Candidatus Angelobacter sp.]
MKEYGSYRLYQHHALQVALKPFSLLIVFFIFLSCPSWAALGDNEQSIQRDAARMKATSRIVQASAYSVHEIQAPSGYIVREYVSPGGSVFAVSWSGPGGLDLQSLLGAYFDEFRQNVAARPVPAQRPLVLNSPTLIFEQSGHMRAIRGRAYVPKLLPSGVDPNQIQ